MSGPVLGTRNVKMNMQTYFLPLLRSHSKIYTWKVKLRPWEVECPAQDCTVRWYKACTQSLGSTPLLPLRKFSRHESVSSEQGHFVKLLDRQKKNQFDNLVEVMAWVRLNCRCSWTSAGDQSSQECLSPKPSSWTAAFLLQLLSNPLNSTKFVHFASTWFLFLKILSQAMKNQN